MNPSDKSVLAVFSQDQNGVGRWPARAKAAQAYRIPTAQRSTGSRDREPGVRPVLARWLIGSRQKYAGSEALPAATTQLGPDARRREAEPSCARDGEDTWQHRGGHAAMLAAAGRRWTSSVAPVDNADPVNEPTL
ncbi:MAG: hypothetical protein JWO57_1073 [Pseudonocardiales bacterium]|nr:hypothetical protein [Pseudonocardiales bacterium]